MEHQQLSAGDGAPSVSGSQTGLQALPDPEGFPASAVEFLRWLHERSIRGYGSGCAHGKAAASIYLQRLSTEPADQLGFTFQFFALNWEERMCEARARDDQDTIDGLRGQAVGFFCALERWLKFASSHLRYPEEQALMASMLDAEAGGIERRWDEATAKERSDKARKAANARWAKERAWRESLNA